MDANFNLTQVYKAAPHLGGSLQDTRWLAFTYHGAPFVVAEPPEKVTYTMDAQGRLKQLTYSSGTTITFNYDTAGNRTSVVTT